MPSQKGISGYRGAQKAAVDDQPAICQLRDVAERGRPRRFRKLFPILNHIKQPSAQETAQHHPERQRIHQVGLQPHLACLMDQ